MANTASTTEFAQNQAPAYAAQPIGHVDSLSGSVSAFRADGLAVELAVGLPVYQGDEIVTATGGAVGLVLADQTAFSMAENGRITLDEMVYDPESQEGTIGLSIGEGIFTFISGEIAKTDPEAMVIDTPVATIGIRGTQLGVDFADGENLRVVMMEEEGGFVGEAVIRNGHGVQVLNAAHQGTMVAGLNAAPGAVYTVNTEQLLKQFGDSLGYLPDIGDANPYGIEQTAVESFAEEELAEEELAGEALVEEALAGDIAEEEVLAEEAPLSSEGEATDSEEVAAFETAAGQPEAETQTETIKVVAGDYTTGETVTPVFVPPATGETVTATATPTAPSEARRDEPVVAETVTETVTASEPEPEPEPINTEPVAFDETGTTSEDNVLSGQLTATDIDQDALTFSLDPDGAPQHGAITLNADGSYSYLPDENFSGADTFTYQVSDGRGGVDSATVTLNVTPVADQPTLEVADVSFGTDILPGDDKIEGGKDDDVLYGGGGDDTIDGKSGNDILYGDSGGTGPATLALDITAALTDTDTSESLSITLSGLPEGASLSAGSETDGVWSLESDDLEGLSVTLPEGYVGDFQIGVQAMATEVGTDETAETAAIINVTYGGAEAGDDILKGGSGDDVLYGEAGNDSLSGGGGEDVLYGGAGDDTLKGEGDDDELFGGGGDDLLVGGGGDDVLYGGDDNDTLKGEGGDDVLFGGGGDDLLVGGGGEDTFVFGIQSGSDTITDYHKGEALRFEGNEFSEGDLVVTPDGDHAVITFGNQNVEVTVNNLNLTEMSYTVTQEPDAVVVVFDEAE